VYWAGRPLHACQPFAEIPTRVWSEPSSHCTLLRRAFLGSEVIRFTWPQRDPGPCYFTNIERQSPPHSITFSFNICVWWSIFVLVVMLDPSDFSFIPYICNIDIPYAAAK
jgi:hypothetical protein